MGSFMRYGSIDDGTTNFMFGRKVQLSERQCHRAARGKCTLVRIFMAGNIVAGKNNDGQK